MSKKRSLLFRGAALLVVLAVAALMFVIGRGHSLYIDNKTVEYQGKTYECFHKVEVTVKGERVAKLYEKERGAASWMGANFKMTLEITADKNSEPTVQEVTVTLPRNMDGIIINLPALLAGLPEEAYLSEFVPAVPETDDNEEIPTGEDVLIGEDVPSDF